MVGIQGLGGVPEPKSERPAKTRGDRDAVSNPSAGATTESSSTVKDAVKISSEAQAAAEIARIVQLTKTQEEIRLERVNAAREKIQSGDYKKPEVVARVAERVMKYLG